MATVPCSPLPYLDSLSFLASKFGYFEKNCHQCTQNHSAAPPSRIRAAQLHLFDELTGIRLAVSSFDDAHRSC